MQFSSSRMFPGQSYARSSPRAASLMRSPGFASSREGAQAGLSWSTILRRRDGYRRAFENFDIERVAAFDDADIQRLLNDAGIIRNRQKILASIENARQVLKVQDECGSFDAYVWGFVNGQVIDHRFTRMEEIPATTTESEAMSKALRKRGFGFVGPTICPRTIFD